MSSLLQDEPSRFIVGIDLGTTNSAVATFDTQEKAPVLRDFAVPQVVGPGQVEARDLLPSFHYEAAPHEFAPGALRLPWQVEDPRCVVGFFAQDQGALVPGRLALSAKSWLCHAGVDRTAGILPWHAASDVERLSPVQVTSRFLAHMREAWNDAHPEHPLETQDVVLTVPASFDEVARELTVQAAREAGLPRLTLLEEPQAAFYAWLHVHQGTWHTRVAPGQRILVCDVGGGTADFTLIEVRAERDELAFRRIAVGEHLILGGDNLDLALAYHVERKLAPRAKLDPRQFSVLVRSSRYAKEALLGPSPRDEHVITISSGGAALLRGALQVSISQEEVKQVLLEGFLPFVRLDERPGTRQSGFQEFGLPYAPDPAITRYLAAFLTDHRDRAREGEGAGALEAARPDVVLFNGGCFYSPALEARLLEVIRSWFAVPPHGDWEPVVLRNARPELAVARGAACFGLVRRGIGVRIAAGLPRSYYIGVEVASAEPTTLCLVPAGLQEGEDVRLSERPLDLLIRQPVEFPLYSSSVRTVDRPGDLVPVDAAQMTALPPIRTVLHSGKRTKAETARVLLNARLTEIGTLDLWCSEAVGTRSWQLQFDVRSATRPDIEAHEGVGEAAGFVDQGIVERCRSIVQATLGAQASRRSDPRGIVKRLEGEVGMGRHEWPPSLLRSLWEDVMGLERCRTIDPTYEATWLHLVGFCLRPGFGYAVDDWRVARTWRLASEKPVHVKNQSCGAEWWILWRRLAGGLNAGQQRSLAQPLLATIRGFLAGRGAAGSTGGPRSRRKETTGVQELAEMWRLLGACEQLPVAIKSEIGELALRVALEQGPLCGPALWALGRIGSRVPQYGPLNEVVSVETVDGWISKIVESPPADRLVLLVLMQLARKTGDRYRDVSEATQQRLIDTMRAQGAAPHLIDLVTTGGRLDDAERTMVLADSLPKGLRLAGGV
ncbi:MAG: Hsp70 family protein [Planctomycetota bacterium]